MTAALGAEVAVEAWGESGAAEEVASFTEGGFPGEIDLGGGFKLKLSPDMMRQIMHHPTITAAVEARCKAMTAACNSLAITKGAVYEYEVSTNPSNIRARGRVRPQNFKAVVDDAAHSTLLKALASVGSDPIPDTEPPEEGPGDTGPGDSGPSPADEGEAGAEGAEAAEGAAGAEELADVAVIALA